MATQQTFAFLETDSVRVAKRPAARSRAGLPQTEPTVLAAGAEGTVGQLSRPEASDDGSLKDPEPQQLGRAAVLSQLRKSIGCVTTSSTDTTPKFSTGSEALDRWLPQGGLRTDALTEWVAGDSCGGATLAMIAAATHLQSDGVSGPLVIVDGEGTFYPPAAISLGISAERIILVRPRRHADVVWSIDQALRCQSVAAVWAHVSSRLDDRDARRFQLAAETGCTPGLLVRPASVRGRPSFADVRFHVGEKGVRPLLPERPFGCFAQKRPDPFFDSSRPLHVTLDRCRGGRVGRHMWVQIDDQAHIREVATETTSLPTTSTTASVHSIESIDHEKASALRLASELAHPTSSKPATERRA